MSSPATPLHCSRQPQVRVCSQSFQHTLTSGLRPPLSLCMVSFLQGRSTLYTQPQLNSCTASRCSRVYGNSYENVLVAVVVPDKKALTAWASDNGLGNTSFEELCDNSKVRTYAHATIAARA